MRSTSFLRTAALAIVAILAAGVFAMSGASAQTDGEFVVEEPIICGTDFFGRVPAGLAPFSIAYSLEGPQNITLPQFRVGTAGAFQSPAGYLAGVPYGNYMVTATLVDSTGKRGTTTFAGLVSASCGATSSVPVELPADTATEPQAVAVAQPATTAPAAQPAAPTALATTGPEKDLPMLVGSLLVAAGAAALAIEKRRNRWA